MKAEGKGNGGILGQVPVVDAEKSLRLYRALSSAIEKGLVASAQPVGLGGLGVAIAKKCIAGALGAKMDLSRVPHAAIDSDDTLLFSESQGRLVVTVAPENKVAFERAMEGNVFAEIGVVSGNRLEARGLKGNAIVSLSLADLDAAYRKTLGCY
jgi:phosphoribosylformylglycinamidine synthase